MIPSDPARSHALLEIQPPSPLEALLAVYVPALLLYASLRSPLLFEVTALLVSQNRSHMQPLPTAACCCPCCNAAWVPPPIGAACTTASHHSALCCCCCWWCEALASIAVPASTTARYAVCVATRQPYEPYPPPYLRLPPPPPPLACGQSRLQAWGEVAGVQRVTRGGIRKCMQQALPSEALSKQQAMLKWQADQQPHCCLSPHLKCPSSPHCKTQTDARGMCEQGTEMPQAAISTLQAGC